MSTGGRARWSRVAGDLRPEGWLVAGAGLAVLAGQGLGVVAPVLVGHAVDAIDRHDSASVTRTLSAMIIVMGATVASTYVGTRFLGLLGQRYLARLRGRLLQHLFTLDADYAVRQRTGRVVSRLTSDVDNLQTFFESALGVALSAVFAISLTLSAMLSQDVVLTLSLATVGLPIAIVALWFRRHAYAAQITVRESTARLMIRLNESLNGIRLVQAYAVEDEHRALFETENGVNYRARMRTVVLLMFYYPLIEFLQPVAMSIVLWVGLTRAEQGHLRVGVVVTFVLLLSRLFDPIQQFAELNSQMQAAASSFARVFAFLDERPRIFDADGAVALRAGRGEVRLENITFTYSADGPAVLRELDLTIAAGQRVALVGESGSGKSTLARLLPRFYDPTQGRVLLDGHDLRSVTLASLRRQVTLVSQEGFLFDGTVADNIALGNPEIPPHALREACAHLGVLEALERLPAGLETVIGGGGTTLSAGERQLVALARAMLADPPVIVLDEATSNVDPATEQHVDLAMTRLLVGRTALVIAHRVPTALRCDRVLMLDEGRVVEDGEPGELIAAGGTFARWVQRASHASAHDISTARTTPTVEEARC